MRDVHYGFSCILFLEKSIFNEKTKYGEIDIKLKDIYWTINVHLSHF